MNKILFFFIILLTSCSQSSPDRRIDLIGELNSNQFDKKIYLTSYFNIYSLEKIKNENKLIVYIEGDGLSWIDRFTASSDPTPVDPLAFKLSLVDGSENIVYLARPCQFEWSNNCNKDIWTNSQYSSIVLNSYKEIINNLSKKYKEIHLVGYSGGAGIVMYLGSINNKSIKSIRTVAGNINHNELSKLLNISKLENSINFYSIEKKTKEIPQVHYYGLLDKTVPNELQIAFAKRNLNNNCIKIKSVSDTGHSEGWLDFWSKNNNKIPNC